MEFTWLLTKMTVSAGHTYKYIYLYMLFFYLLINDWLEYESTPHQITVK